MSKSIYMILLACLMAVNPILGEDCSPPPFEKIYIATTDILTTPEGIFYINDLGMPERVRALREDCNGLYVIKFLCQCPICEKFYSGNSPEEGFDCPLRKTEDQPGTWSK